MVYKRILWFRFIRSPGCCISHVGFVLGRVPRMPGCTQKPLAWLQEVTCVAEGGEGMLPGLRQQASWTECLPRTNHQFRRPYVTIQHPKAATSAQALPGASKAPPKSVHGTS